MSFGVTRFFGGLDSAVQYTISAPSLNGGTPSQLFMVSSGNAIGDYPAQSPIARISLGYQSGPPILDIYGWASIGAVTQNGVSATQNKFENVYGVGTVLKAIFTPTSNHTDGVVQGNAFDGDGFIPNGMTYHNKSFDGATSDSFGFLAGFMPAFNNASNAPVWTGGGNTTTYNPLNGTVPVTPDLLLFLGPVVDGLDDYTTPAAIGIGAALSDGTQFCLGWREPNGASSGSPILVMRDDRVIVLQDSATTGTVLDVKAQNFTSNSVDFVSNNSTPKAWLPFGTAASVEGLLTSLFSFTTPTSTGVVEYNTPGFHPEFVLLVCCTQTQFNVAAFSNLSESFSIGMLDGTVDGAGSASIYVQSGASPTNTASRMTQSAIYLSATASTPLVEAEFSAFSSTGFALNYTTVDASPRVGFALVLGERSQTRSRTRIWGNYR